MIHSSKAPHILVIDNQISDFQELRTLLGGKYELAYARSDAKALTYMAHNRVPDLIINSIPELDIVDLVRIIRNKYGMIPFLFMIASEQRNVANQCKKLSRAGYIIKPYKATFLKSEIDRILNGQDEYE